MPAEQSDGPVGHDLEPSPVAPGTVSASPPRQRPRSLWSEIVIEAAEEEEAQRQQQEPNEMPAEEQSDGPVDHDLEPDFLVPFEISTPVRPLPPPLRSAAGRVRAHGI